MILKVFPFESEVGQENATVITPINIALEALAKQLTQARVHRRLQGSFYINIQ